MHLCLPLALLLAGLLCLGGGRLPASRKARGRPDLHASSIGRPNAPRVVAPSSPPASRLQLRSARKNEIFHDKRFAVSSQAAKDEKREIHLPQRQTVTYRSLRASSVQLHRTKRRENSPASLRTPTTNNASAEQERTGQILKDKPPAQNTVFKIPASERDCKPCSCRKVDEDNFVVNCTARGLSSIPSRIPAKATQLLMAYNEITHLEPESFRRFHHVRLLDLSLNAISNLSRETFQGLSRLRVLHLHGNRLPYTADVFTAEVLAPLQSLRRLTLHNNTADMAEDLDYPDLALSRLPLLETLSLDGLTNRSFGGGFAKLVNLRNLSLSGHDGFCKLMSIHNATFENIPNLRLLNLTNCHLTFVDAGSFLLMRNIDTLDVSQNTMLGFDFFPNVTYGLQNSSIRVLMLNDMHGLFQTCVTVLKADIAYLKYTNLEELHMAGNNIETIEKDALLALSNNIRKLFAARNEFMFGPYYLDFSLLKNLVVLHIDYFERTTSLPGNLAHHLKHLETLSVGCGCSRMSVDAKRLLQPNEVTQLRQIVGIDSFVLPLPPKLKEFYLSKRTMTDKLTRIHFSKNVLETLDLSGNLFKIWKGPIENVPHLKFVDLSTNYASVWTKDFMTYMDTLEVLDISENLLSDVLAREDSGDLLENQRNLRDLSMSSNGIYSLPRSVFRGLSSLQRLYLYGNRITAEGFNASLSHMVNLSFLDLSYNVLDRLQPATCDMLDQLARGGNSSLTVNLNSNPLACTCGNRAFLSWLRDTPVLLFKREQLQCVLDNGTVVHLWSQMDALDGRCVETVGLFMGSAVGSLLILVILVGLVVYRYRWKLRYLYYAARGHYRREQGVREEFRYDAFLSYAEEDSQWVTGQLLPHLEGDHNLRVCLHQRDFLPGKSIISNIVDAVQTSRRTVCVLSPDFLESYWCLYEMQMAKMEGLHTGRDAVLLLLYQPLRADALPREVVCYMHTESYLEYPRDPRCLAAFYDNLRLALRQP